VVVCLIITLLLLVHKMCQWKKFENRSIFDEDMENRKVGQFFWDTVYIHGSYKFDAMTRINRHRSGYIQTRVAYCKNIGLFLHGLPNLFSVVLERMQMVAYKTFYMRYEWKNLHYTCKMHQSIIYQSGIFKVAYRCKPLLLSLLAG